MTTKPAARRRPSIYVGRPLDDALAATGADGPGGNLSGRINTVAERFMALARPAMGGLGLPAGDWQALRAIHARDDRPLDLASQEALARAIAAPGALDWLAQAEAIRLAARVRALSQAEFAALAEALDRLDPDLPIAQALTAIGIPH